MENLSLSQNTHLETASNYPNGYGNLSVLEVKTEESQIPICSAFDYINSFVPSYGGGCENAVKMMQRSFSSNSFDGKPSFLFQPRLDSLMESPNFHTQVLSSSSGQMRRVCSTGDLHSIKTSQMRQRLSSSPLATESSFMEEANSKVGKYSAEERKERIQRYRAKRTQRNFNKTIKYACRKTLADNRPRIRGRFARNDEAGEIPKTATGNRYEDEDDLWIEGFNEEGDEGRGSLFSSQFQYYAYE